ncbi:hypothetical protein NPIL_651031 [Nephila pilipes]|uniref:Uncharacterized protein n=1 Tax=Nephila pilipes TaxID=299642 RepID=A0A8X6NQQ5_NEPPI|nr:hypothetical protein NPIL_651031 [Nephila pilipes]
MKVMEDFNAIPSLCFLIAFQIIFIVWNRNDIMRSITEWLNIHREKGVPAHEIYRMQEDITSYVQEIVASLEGIPPIVKSEMADIVFSIGRHIKAWKCFSSTYPNFNIEYLKIPVNHWTVYGTVNTKRHSELFVKDSLKNYIDRYIMACDNCFEEIIVELFPSLTSEDKAKFLAVGEPKELINYWTYRLSGDLSSFSNLIPGYHIYKPEYRYSVHQFAFSVTLLNGNKSGIEYFLKYLPPNDFEYVLCNHLYFFPHRRIAGINDENNFPEPLHEHFTDALYFLLSKLNKTQRMNVLNKHSFIVLLTFLRYPFYGIFSKYIKILIKKLPWYFTLIILNRICTLEKKNAHFFGLKLFEDLFFNCPQNQKVDIMGNEDFLKLVLNDEQFFNLHERIRKAEENYHVKNIVSL